MSENSHRSKPFERQEGESEKAYQAFRTYIDLGADRSLAAVGQKLRKSKALMERWSSRWKWVRRVEAYTDFMVRKADSLTVRKLKPIATWLETLAEVSEIAMANPDLRENLEFQHKLKALELLGKFHGLFGDEVKDPGREIGRPAGH